MHVSFHVPCHIPSTSPKFESKRNTTYIFQITTQKGSYSGLLLSQSIWMSGQSRQTLEPSIHSAFPGLRLESMEFLFFFIFFLAALWKPSILPWLRSRFWRPTKNGVFEVHSYYNAHMGINKPFFSMEKHTGC